MARGRGIRLKTRLALVGHTSWPLLGAFFLGAVAVAQVFAVPFLAVLVVAVVAFVAMTRFTPRLVIQRAYAALRRSCEEEDVAGARAQLEELREVYAGSATALEQLHMTESSLLELEGKHAEACKLLESLDRKRLGPSLAAWADNNLAWSLAHAGRAIEGAALARAALEKAGELPDAAPGGLDLRAHLLGTLGTALVLGKEHHEGLALLEQAMARGGRPRALAARSFYLAEAYRGLGREEEASKAYEQARSAAPASSYARRATERLTARLPYRT